MQDFQKQKADNVTISAMYTLQGKKRTFEGRKMRKEKDK